MNQFLLMISQNLLNIFMILPLARSQIHYQISKHLPKSSKKCLPRLFNVIWERGQFPVSWTRLATDILNLIIFSLTFSLFSGKNHSTIDYFVRLETFNRDASVNKERGVSIFLGHLSHSGDLLLWVGVRRRASCGVRRPSSVVR